MNVPGNKVWRPTGSRSWTPARLLISVTFLAVTLACTAAWRVVVCQKAEALRCAATLKDTLRRSVMDGLTLRDPVPLMSFQDLDWLLDTGGRAYRIPDTPPPAVDRRPRQVGRPGAPPAYLSLPDLSPAESRLPYVGTITPPLPGERVPEPLKREAEAFLRLNESCLALVHGALRRTDNPPRLLRAQPDSRQALARLLLLECLVAADDGHSDVAADALLCAVLICQGQWRASPGMERAYMRNSLATALQYLLARGGPDDERLRVLTIAIDGLWDQNLPAVLIAEICSDRLSSLEHERDWARAISDLNRLNCLAIAVVNRTVPQTVASLDDSSKDTQFRSLRNCVRQGDENARLVSVLHAAIAIHRYRRDNGALPESLDVLFPRYCNRKPFSLATGQSLRYTVDDHGATIADDSICILLVPKNN